jgi:hypothetical protein
MSEYLDQIVDGPPGRDLNRDVPAPDRAEPPLTETIPAGIAAGIAARPEGAEAVVESDRRVTYASSVSSSARRPGR